MRISLEPNLCQRWRSPRRPAVFILAILGATLVGLPAPQQRPPVFRAGTEHVVVPVTVKDARGRLVGGLRPDEFRLLEDGTEQEITGVSSDPAALSVAALIDAGLSRPTAQRLRSTFPSLLEAFSEFDEAAIFSFDTTVRAEAGFTAEKEKHRNALAQMDFGADTTRAGEPLTPAAPVLNRWPVGGGAASAPARQNFKNIDDAVLSAVRLLGARDPGRRKIVLLISDGLNSPRNKIATADLLAGLRKSGVVVYSIGLDDAKLSKGSSVLARYGPASGGEMFTAIKQAAIGPLYARITEQARYQYILTYAPRKPPIVAPVFRSIEVRVKRPAMTVIARNGYIPEPRAPQP